jgi:GH24 family phage-related lysozyme (muramidase)
MKYALLFLTIFLTSKTLSTCNSTNYPVKKESGSISLKQAEVSKIKLAEGFKSKPYKDINGNLCIGYGFLVRYWWKKDSISIEQADSLIVSIYDIMLSYSTKDFPNNKDSLKIAHLYYWYGNTKGKRMIRRNDNWKSLTRLNNRPE